jgi:hypothetical protein
MWRLCSRDTIQIETIHPIEIMCQFIHCDQALSMSVLWAWLNRRIGHFQLTTNASIRSSLFCSIQYHSSHVNLTNSCHQILSDRVSRPCIRSMIEIFLSKTNNWLSRWSIDSNAVDCFYFSSSMTINNRCLLFFRLTWMSSVHTAMTSVVQFHALVIFLSVNRC